jgi:glutamate-ammonia-ligase adenylyltransferase
VIPEEWKKTIQSLCGGIERRLIEEFFDRMDEDYFTRFSVEEIAAHIRMSSLLNSSQPIQVRVIPKSDPAGEFGIVIVGFDYLSEFSIFCGLLSAFGLDIHSGDIYSFRKKQARKAAPRKIVDVFYVSGAAHKPFDESTQKAFVDEMQSLAQLLAAGAIQEARERLNRFLIERIEQMDEALRGLMSPVHIHFDNETSADWTILETRSEDAFAFLYSISNALSMRGVYINKVRIRSSGGEATDQFFISDRWGRKIEEPREQKRLRTAVAMIKQFTHFLPAAPDPAKAMRHFDQFLDKAADEQFPDHVIAFLAGADGMNLLAHLLGSSDYLWDDFLGIHLDDLLPVLEDLAQTQLRTDAARLHAALAPASTFEEEKRILNQFKDAELFRIDAKHLLEPQVTLLEFSHALTELAEAVVIEAANACLQQSGGPRGSFAICGLGKFGGREMGYASDMELLFVHEFRESTHYFESVVRQITEFIDARRKGIFHIDLRLRPYGDAGPWSIPFDEFARYYSPDGGAAPFERQALIKLRWIGGDATLGRRVEEHRDAFTYSGAPWDAQNALHLRERQMRELVRPGKINVKYSAGGIIDIEYAVQYLQLQHGEEHPDVRVPNTGEALDQLRRAGIVAGDEYESLHSAYFFLRNVIDALRVVRGDASDLVLPDENSDDFKALARRLGYREKDRNRGAALLAADIRAQMGRAQKQFGAISERGTTRST